MSGNAMFEKVSEVELYRNNVITLVKASFKTREGRVFERDVVRHLGAVSIVALLDDSERVVLMSQFRAAFGRPLIEVPAGKRDISAEPPEITGVRELEEETGLRCASLVRLGEFENSPGFTDEHSYAYLARGLSLGTIDPQSVEELESSVVIAELRRVEQLISDGIITDGKTIIALARTADFLACEPEARESLYPTVWRSDSQVSIDQDSVEVGGWAESLSTL